MPCPFDPKATASKADSKATASKSDNENPNYFNPLAWVLARYAFVMTHIAFVYFLLHVSNDPLNLGFINTIDANSGPLASCQTFNGSALLFDLALLFGVWWLPHSSLAREPVKKALGLWTHPLDRPIFAFLASTGWFLTVHLWKPIDTCHRFDIGAVSIRTLVVGGVVLGVMSLSILSLLYILPQHVFGTSSHKFPPGHYDAHENVLVDFPYGLSRHPAAAGFFWIYALFIGLYYLGYTTINHVVLSTFWIIFITVSTLLFEEGGIKEGKDEFSKRYLEYHERTGFIFPTAYSVKRCLGFSVPKYSWEAESVKSK